MSFQSKIIFVTLFVSSLSFGMTLSQSKSSEEGPIRQTFAFSKKELTWTKISNFYDQKKDLRLGTFTAKNNAQTKTLEAEVQKIKDQIKRADDLLKKSGSGFNQLNALASTHESSFELDQYKIVKNSELYPKVHRVFVDLQNIPYRQKDGIEIDSALKKLKKYQNYKLQSESKLDLKQVCHASETADHCDLKGFGLIYF